MNVAPYLTEAAYVPSTVPVLVGTPPQQMNLTVDVSAGLIAAYGSDCILCAGTTMFDPSLSSTFKTNNTPWPASVPSFGGVEVSDTVGFGGVVTVSNQPFVNILDGSDQTFANSIWNGHLGLFLNPLNATSIAQHVLTHLYESSSLLNPVVGMRFDPANPKVTIGALDPNDYEGTINWVQLDQTPDPKGDYFNVFEFDGVKGYDGQFVPYGGNLSAALDSFFLSIALPNADTYFLNTNSTGPVPQPLGLINDTGVVQYNCNSSSPASLSGPPQSPYVALTATINGVDYPIDSTGNLLRPQSGASSAGFCPVGIRNRSDTAQPNVVFGLPFLRSVYIAYRFPTDDCPGYYGFAFPAGSNRTQSQISQTPTATPTNSARCLSLAAPTSTPTANVVLAQEALTSKDAYTVYGEQGTAQVPLTGVNDLPKIVWNWTALSG
ncbi:aspartic peptidase domain-containing protein [Boletus reticuloceps]|uniref:Aspartic peptidase domain-containing protein n=1 Tax=Boletus reticuloceps TaxID=495285 RepID=A0A8I2YNE6_9AGAM|nr:aspartic peptidase domain-containing protein [Boletus reticuloceps]